jgi:hypothetical protein
MKIMYRRDFLKTAAVSLVVGDLVVAKEGTDSRAGEVGKVAEITKNGRPIDVEYDDEVVHFHPDEVERIPTVRFNTRGQICNVEDLMRGPIVYEPNDMRGTVYSVWLDEEDYVVCSSPWANIGTFWGLVHVEVKKLTGDVWVVTLHPTDKSVRHNVRDQTTIYSDRKPLE